MKIKKLELINFKRFTHLVINHIPETAKLVLLIGANGSGKSSVFDGFDFVSKGWDRFAFDDGIEDYYKKDKTSKPIVHIHVFNGAFPEKKKDN